MLMKRCSSCYKAVCFIILSFLFSTSLFSQTAEEVFTKIYKRKFWGKNEEGKGTSGSGSTAETTVEYRALLQDLLEQLEIKSVVDVGCGDWEFSQLIDWDGIDYRGYDVVKPVILTNQKKFTKDNIHFAFRDATRSQLPKADLIICKDVLQHLSFEDIFKVTEQFSKYKYCLITNDIILDEGFENEDCVKGDWRPIDLTKPPFGLSGYSLLTYEEGENIKQVLLICN